MIVACQPAVKPTPPEEPPTAVLPPHEQNALAMLDYEDMLDLTTEHGKRNVLPQLEESHREIITKYPDAFLAKESYWRLVEMNLTDYYPPRMDKAEQIREEFIQKYPGSKMIRVIDDSMARYYYRERHWDRLLRVCALHIRNFIETDELESPLFMFYYSEAKFNTQDFVEAEKGYKILVKRFPGSHEARIAKQRIREINMSKKMTGN
jgi:hypothetical protein